MSLLPRRAARLLAHLCWLLCVIPACYGPTLSDAKNALPQELYCPPDRIVALRRADLSLVHFGCLSQARWRVEPKDAGAANPARARISGFASHETKDLVCGAPPPEIEANPGRLRLWLEQREKGFRDVDHGDDTIFEVTGCGARHFYNCVGNVTNGCLRAPPTCHDLGDADPALEAAPTIAVTP